MKSTTIVILVILGLYWLLDHHAPLPLNHDSFGLYEHNIHRIIGIVLLVIAALVAWLWKRKQPQATQMTQNTQVPQNPNANPPQY